MKNFINKFPERLTYLVMLSSNALVICCIHLCCIFSPLFKRKATKKLLLMPYIPSGNAGDVARFALYLPLLTEKGFAFDIFYPSNQSTFNSLFITHPNKRRQYVFYMKIFWRRFFIVLKASKYESVYLQRELFPFYPDQNFPHLSKLLRKLNNNIVIDFYDPDYLINKNLVDNAVKFADKVTVANKELFDYFTQFKEKIFMHPLAIDMDVYETKKAFAINGKVEIFWTGSYYNSLKLLPLIPMLKKLNEKFPLHLKVVCPIDAGFDPSFCSVIPWNEKTFFHHLASADIALYPVGGNLDLERNKTAFKPLEYAAAKVPMVASPLGLTEFFRDGQEVLLADSDEEWQAQLEKLITSETLRMQLAENAFKQLKLHHDYHRSFDRLMEAIES